MTACPNGHQNPDGHKFCGECAAAIVTPPMFMSASPAPIKGLSGSPGNSETTGQVIGRDALGELTKVGQGGQGVVYAAPKVVTTFASSMVFKEYKPQVLSGIDFTALAAMPALVEDALSYAQAERLISMASWPCRIVESAGAPSGFVMPAIPEAFFTTLTTVKGESLTTAEFQHLLNHPSVLAARGIILTDAQRYGLLRQVASGLSFLHGHGVCVGDISPKNLLYSLAPHEAVYVIDCDAMRINGVSALTQVETPGWEVPIGEELATIYSDTYKLGLLALRLLVGDQDTANPAYLPTSVPGLLRQLITDTLGNAPQRRPLPEAWAYVLGHSIEEAQHRASTARAPAPTALPAPKIPVVQKRPTAAHSRSSNKSPAKAAANAAPRQQQKAPTALRIGDWVKIRVPGDDRDGHVGRIIELFSYEPGVIVRFDDEPDPYAFQRSEVKQTTPAAKRQTSSPWQPTRKPLKIGKLVMIRVPGDDRDGHVGRIIELFSYEPGVIVRFDDEPDPYAFQRSEVQMVTLSKNR